jgi:hypothetical protein
VVVMSAPAATTRLSTSPKLSSLRGRGKRANRSFDFFVSWSPARVLCVSCLEVALLCAAFLLPSRDLGPGHPAGDWAAKVGAVAAVGSLAVCFLRPYALCPCHVLGPVDFIHHACNGMIGGMAFTGCIAMLLLVFGGGDKPAVELDGECGMGRFSDRAAVSLALMLVCTSHTVLPLVVAAHSRVDVLRRILFRLKPGGPLEASVLSGSLGFICGGGFAVCHLGIATLPRDAVTVLPSTSCSTVRGQRRWPVDLNQCVYGCVQLVAIFQFCAAGKSLGLGGHPAVIQRYRAPSCTVAKRVRP